MTSDPGSRKSECKRDLYTPAQEMDVYVFRRASKAQLREYFKPSLLPLNSRSTTSCLSEREGPRTNPESYKVQAASSN